MWETWPPDYVPIAKAPKNYPGNEKHLGVSGLFSERYWNQTFTLGCVKFLGLEFFEASISRQPLVSRLTRC